MLCIQRMVVLAKGKCIWLFLVLTGLYTKNSTGSYLFLLFCSWKCDYLEDSLEGKILYCYAQTKSFLDESQLLLAYADDRSTCCCIEISRTLYLVSISRLVQKALSFSTPQTCLNPRNKILICLAASQQSKCYYHAVCCRETTRKLSTVEVGGNKTQRQ